MIRLRGRHAISAKCNRPYRRTTLRAAITPKHNYESHLRWTGAAHGPTSSYAGYSRDYDIDVDGKATLHGSADPTFRGDASRHNPEDLLVAALSSCHLLSYLALAARAGVNVTAYEDSAVGQMVLQG